MKIEDLIKELDRVKEQHGNIECVIEAETVFDRKINSTVETLRIVDFGEGKAVRLYWQMF